MKEVQEFVVPFGTVPERCDFCGRPIARVDGHRVDLKAAEVRGGVLWAPEHPDWYTCGEMFGWAPGMSPRSPHNQEW